MKTVSIKERHSLVHLKDFPKPCLPGADFRQFLDSLPPYLAARDLRELVDLLGEARKKNRPIIWAMGAHVVKLGLGPLLVDLMQRGWVSAIASNGAMMIHDFELALAGHTSEDVDAQPAAGHVRQHRRDGALPESGSRRTGWRRAWAPARRWGTT